MANKIEGFIQYFQTMRYGSTFVRFSLLIMIGTAVVLQTGCVMGRRTPGLPVISAAAVPAATRGDVYIVSVTDNRKFENKPSDPSVPSIDGDVTKMSAVEKDQMIGRQRNTYGHAMGDISLPAGESVTQKVRLLVEQGLVRDGYKVSANPNAANSVAISIGEFWAWTTPGFIALTFEAKIMCLVVVNNGDGSGHTATVRGYGKNLGQFAKDVNWQEAYAPAFEDFVTNLARELDTIGLHADDQGPIAVQGKSGESSDMYSELTKLDQLRKAGIINEQEFEAQKKKILKRN